MKKVLLLSFTLLHFLNSFSQNDCLSSELRPNDRDLFFDFLGGVSIPLGAFSTDDLNGGSYAQAGLSATAQLTWMVFGDVGVRIGCVALFHPVDAVSLARDELEADPFMEDLSIRSESYRMIDVFASVLYRKEFTQKIDVMASVGVGMFYVETPHQLYRAEYYMVGNNYFEITSAGDYAIMYNAGIEAEYKLKESWSLLLGSKFSYAKTQFTFKMLGQDYRIDKRTISMLDLYLGFRLRF